VLKFKRKFRRQSVNGTWILGMQSGVSQRSEENEIFLIRYWSRDNSVGIATTLWAERFGDRIPVGARFSESVRKYPGAHPASYAMGTGSFPGVRRPGRGIDHSPHLAPRLKIEYSYASIPPLSLRGLFWGEIYLLSYIVSLRTWGITNRQNYVSCIY